MSQQYIVRADFYPDGTIIPLGITDEYGKTTFIQKIKKTIRISSTEYKIECIANGKNVILLLKNNSWVYREET